MGRASSLQGLLRLVLFVLAAIQFHCADGATSTPGPPASVSLSVLGKDSIEVFVDPPISDGGSPITAYTVEWDKEEGVPEVQRISTALDLGANEVQSITTTIEDVNEVQIIRTSATPRGEVQTITVSPPPGESILESAYSFAILLNTTSMGGSVQYSGQISATAAADGSRAAVSEILSSMSNIPATPTVVKSATNADGGHSYTITFPTSMRNVPQMEVFMSDVPVSIETVHDANLLGGWFRLEFDGEVTDDIPADASAAVMQSTLEELSTVSTVMVSRSAIDDQGGYSWEIEFTSDDNGGNLYDLIPYGDGLTTTNTAAGGALVEIAPGGRTGSYIQGTFTIEFDGEMTGPLPSDADASTVKEALEALSTIEGIDVEWSGLSAVGGCKWMIRFLEDGGARTHRGDMPPLVVLSDLNGGGSTVSPSIKVMEERKGTLMEVQTIEVAAGGPSVDPTSSFRLRFQDEETGDIFALPAGGTTCLGSTAAKQIITTSTEDTTGEGGDATVSHITTFTLTYEAYTTAQVAANGDGSCEDTALIIAEELEKIPPLYSVSVSGSSTDVGDEGCSWIVTFESVVGNPELFDISAYHGDELDAVGPATSVTVGPSPSIVRDTVAVTQPPEFHGDVDLIQSELSKLSTVGLVSVTADDIVPDAAGQCRWRVTFESNAGDMPAIQVAPSGSTDFSHTAALNSGDTVTVTENVVQGTSIPLSGDFSLSFGGEMTGYLPYDASADAIKYSLEGLESIGKIDVERHGPDVNDCYTWDVIFVGDVGPQATLVADGLDLEGTVASISVATHIVGVAPPFNGPDYGSLVLTDERNGLIDNSGTLVLYAVISPLRLGTPYYFRASAFNALGSGPTTASKPPFEIPLPQAPSDPGHVDVSVEDSSTLTVTIVEPEHDGGEAVDTYQIDYSSTAFFHEKQRISLTCSPEAEVQTVTTYADDINEIQYLVIDSSYQGGGIVPETQRVYCDATGGNFSLTLGVGDFDGDDHDSETSTAFFAFDADSDAIKQSFESLDIVDSVSISVDTSNGAACAPYDGISAGSFTVTFHSLVGIAGDITPLVPHTSALEGARRIDIETVTDGDAPADGTFRMSFRGSISGQVDASLSPLEDLAAAIQTALEDADTIENDGVVVSAVELSNGGEEKVFAIEFVGSGVGGDVVPIEIPAEHNLLYGSDADAYIIFDGESYIARNGLDTVTSRIGNVLSGTFKLRLRGHTTEAIAFDASVDEIKARLEALKNVGTVNVEVEGPTDELGYVWTITFVSTPDYFPPKSQNIDALEYVNSLLTSVGEDTSATISVEVVQLGSDRLDGTFELTYSDGITTETTLPLSSVAAASDVQYELESLANIGRVHVSRSQSDVGYTWDIEFVGCAHRVEGGTIPGGRGVCNDGDLLPLVATSIDLAGCGDAVLGVVELQAGSGADACPQFASGKCTQIRSVFDPFPIEHYIVGLEVGVPYFVQVRLGNSQGYGDRRLSSPLSATPHYNPPGAPPPVILKQSTSTSLTLMWEPPTVNGGKAVSGYELWMDDWSGGNPFIVYDGPDDPDTLEYTVTTGNSAPLSRVVESGRQYSFQVRAINHCDGTDENLSCHGPFSEPQLFTVREPRRPFPPASPKRDARTTITGSATVSATVTWTRPVDNGGSPITGYILYMKHPDDSMDSFALGPDASSWIVDELQAGEVYLFHLVAINAIGRSGNSPVLSLVAGMPPGIDTASTPTYSTDPFRPIITDVKETEMVIEWSAPAPDSTGGSPVTGYKLYQYEGIGPNTKSNPEPIKQEVQDILMLGGGNVVAGSFTVSFREEVTVSISVDASATDVKFALQNLDTINLVSVESIIHDQGHGWRVSFVSEAGDLPLMQSTSGRLTVASPDESTTSVAARVVVDEHIKGYNAYLVYDGTDQPSVRSYTAGNLLPDARYAFTVAPINQIGDGVLSLATTTTIARAGASAQQTTASGGALYAGIAGSIHEEQIIAFANEFIIEPKKASGAIVRDVTASDGMAGRDEFFTELWSSDPSIIDGAHDWYADGGVAVYNPVRYEEQVIFVPDSFAGIFQLTMDTSPSQAKGRLGGYAATTTDLEAGERLTDLLLENALSALTSIDKVVVSSSITSADVVGDGAAGTAYTVTFVTVLGELPLLSASDSAIIVSRAAHQVGVTEIQTITHSNVDGGTMVLSYDGQYTDDIAFDASAEIIKSKLELLSTIEEVDVRKIDTRTGYQWDVTFTRSVGNLPSIIAHTQVFEVQRIATLGGTPMPLGGSFKLLYGSSEETSSLPFDASAESVKAALQAVSSIGLVDVDRIAMANGQYEWLVTFRRPHTPPRLEIDGSGLSGTLEDASISIVVNADPHSLVSSSGLEPEVVVGEKVSGLPSYTARYTADRVGAYSLAVVKLESGGLNARYYDNQWLLGEPVMERVDETINFDWGSGAVTPYGRDFVSVRWWGKVRPTTNEEYTFYIVADDGVRVFIDHDLVVDAWEDDHVHPGNEQRASVLLTKDNFHDILVEYREETGSASIQLQWSSSSLRKQVISPLQLYQTLHISGSPFPVVISPGAADYNYTAFVDVQGKDRTETVAGEQTHFIIQAKDSMGNNKVYNGDAQGDHQSPEEQLTVDIFGDDIVTQYGPYSGNVEYIGSGQYRVDYMLNKAGKYTVHVKTRGTDIYCGLGEQNKCSPFDLTVKPGPTVPSLSEAGNVLPAASSPVDEDSRTMVDLRAGERGFIQLQAKDSYGNNQDVGGEDFLVKFTSRADGNVQYRGNVMDGDDGTYEITYSIPLAGEYDVYIGLDEKPVPSFDTLNIIHHNVHAQSTSVVELGDAVVGEENGFVVQSRDQFGNLRVGDGDDSDGSSDVFVATFTRIGKDGYQVVTSSAVQVIECTDSSVEGHFRLAYGGQISPDLPHNIQGATMSTILADEQGRRVRVDRSVDVSGNYEWTVMTLSHFDNDWDIEVMPSSDGDSTVSDLLSVSKPARDGIYPIQFVLWYVGTYEVSIVSASTSGRDVVSINNMDVSSGQVSSSSSFVTMNATAVAGEQDIFQIQARDMKLPEVKVLVYDGVSSSVDGMKEALEDVGIIFSTVERDEVDGFVYFVVTY